MRCMDLKILIITFIIVCMILALAIYIFNYVVNVIEMLYAKSCITQTIDQIIKMIRYQQIILAELGIPYKTQLSRNNFSTYIVPLYFGVLEAYWDLPKKRFKFTKDHYASLEASYTDNINALNLLLEDYTVYNIRYRYAKDKCHLINNTFDDFPFLDDKIRYHMDNGIQGTGSFHS